MRNNDLNLVRNVLTSETFYYTSRKAINHTQKTGYETSFGVFSEIRGKEIIYSPYFIVGNEKSVSWKVGAERAKNNFLNKEENSKFRRKRLSNILKLKEFKDFERRNNEQFEVGWGKIIPKENSWNYNFKIKKKNPNEFYPLVGFHTHPKDILTPSKGDLQHLRRMTNLSQGGLINPITIIGIKYNPLLIIQEKENAFNGDFIEKSKLDRVHSHIPIDCPVFQFMTHDVLKYNTLDEELDSLYNFGYLYLDIYRAKGYKENELNFPLEK